MRIPLALLAIALTLSLFAAPLAGAAGNNVTVTRTVSPAPGLGGEASNYIVNITVYSDGSVEVTIKSNKTCADIFGNTGLSIIVPLYAELSSRAQVKKSGGGYEITADYFFTLTETLSDTLSLKTYTAIKILLEHESGNTYRVLANLTVQTERVNGAQVSLTNSSSIEFRGTLTVSQEGININGTITEWAAPSEKLPLDPDSFREALMSSPNVTLNYYTYTVQEGGKSAVIHLNITLKPGAFNQLPNSLKGMYETLRNMTINKLTLSSYVTLNPNRTITMRATEHVEAFAKKDTLTFADLYQVTSPLEPKRLSFTSGANESLKKIASKLQVLPSTSETSCGWKKPLEIKFFRLKASNDPAETLGTIRVLLQDYLGLPGKTKVTLIAGPGVKIDGKTREQVTLSSLGNQKIEVSNKTAAAIVAGALAVAAAFVAAAILISRRS